MPGTPPLADDVVARIRELAAKGLSRNAIARELGISNYSVSKYAGVGFDRSATAAATQAKQVDNKARRASIAERLMAQAERTLTRLEGDTYTYRVKVADSTFVVTDSQPNSEDERNHVTGIAALMQTVARLEALDADAGAAAGRSMLRALGEALGVSGPET